MVWNSLFILYNYYIILYFQETTVLHILTILRSPSLLRNAKSYLMYREQSLNVVAHVGILDQL